jgi:hypothetical protein
MYSPSNTQIASACIQAEADHAKSRLNAAALYVQEQEQVLLEKEKKRKSIFSSSNCNSYIAVKVIVCLTAGTICFIQPQFIPPATIIVSTVLTVVPDVGPSEVQPRVGAAAVRAAEEAAKIRAT